MSNNFHQSDDEACSNSSDPIRSRNRNAENLKLIGRFGIHRKRTRY